MRFHDLLCGLTLLYALSAGCAFLILGGPLSVWRGVNLILLGIVSFVSLLGNGD